MSLPVAQPPSPSKLARRKSLVLGDNVLIRRRKTGDENHPAWYGDVETQYLLYKRENEKLADEDGGKKETAADILAPPKSSLNSGARARGLR